MQLTVARIVSGLVRDFSQQPAQQNKEVLSVAEYANIGGSVSSINQLGEDKYVIELIQWRHEFQSSLQISFQS